MFEIIGVDKGTYLFKKGTSCRDIFIISDGELEVFIYNKRDKPTLLETLGQGCSVGCYSAIMCNDYTISGKAKTDLTVLKLPYTKLYELRE